MSNREIKFRAWDIFRKVMLSNSDIWFKTDVKGYELFCDTPDNRDSLQLTQYIELKDSEGVEYYNEDIGIFPNGDKFVIKKERWLGFFVEWIGEPECEDQARDLYRIEKAKIIGNSFENPELLEV